MGGLLNILSSPLSELVKSIGGIVDNLNTSSAEKLEAQRKLIELERNFQLRMSELDGEWAKAQAGVIEAEAKSEGTLARNWRPILMLVFTYIIAHNYVIAPLFDVVSVPIPPEMWHLLTLGVSGYIGGRSLEKIVPQVAEVLKKK